MDTRTAKGSDRLAHIVTREEVGATTQIDPGEMRSLIAQAARPPTEVPAERAPRQHLRALEALLVFVLALALGIGGTLWWIQHHP